MNKKLPGQSLR